MCASLKTEPEGYFYTACSVGVARLRLPTFTWKTRFEPVTVCFGDEKGVHAHLPPSPIVGHDEVLVAVVCDDDSYCPGLLRVHRLLFVHSLFRLASETAPAALSRRLHDFAGA
jgi:hypothetical protein